MWSEMARGAKVGAQCGDYSRTGDPETTLCLGAGYAAAAAISPSTRRAPWRTVSGDQGDPSLPIEQSPYLVRRSGRPFSGYSASASVIGDRAGVGEGRAL